MAWSLVFWLIAFFVNMAIFAMNIHQLTCLADLQADYMNPYETSSIVNTWVVREFILQQILCASFLVTGHWFFFLLTVPVTCYHVMMFMKQRYLIDVTEVFRVLEAEKKMRMIKMAFYLTTLLIILFRVVIVTTSSFVEEENAWDLFWL
ncbi:Cornichon domain-containing protein [Cephalotus follicularis]|uniref:Cornichon domain-containing protein n=1 Tax=Cephalotus follicularis TaxID=3775 RepID=A0A1Q3B7L1_CEPFO|nr:Cornichon domain-containing protein [Cephalotus follicularis]